MAAKRAWLFGAPRRRTPARLAVACYAVLGLGWLTASLVHGFSAVAFLLGAVYLGIGTADLVGRSRQRRSAAAGRP